MSKEIAEEYASSLADLTVNSKPLINMLTILAEENIEHAGVIVETVEKHLEKVQPDIKLPVLYLVDSIIKNVGGAYTQKFALSIVNMFTRTFKQVDEKIRSQMFKLRETWHDVFPATKLYQLDVKVNLIDPAWPIQVQPHHQSTIHVNPNFLKKTGPTTSTVPVPTVKPVSVLSEEECAIIAKKEQELLMLQKKKIEMELEQTKKQLELAEKNAKKVPPLISPMVSPSVMPVALVNPVTASGMPVIQPDVTVGSIPVKQRLGLPVTKVASNRIAPVSGALAAARRDPRLARHVPTPPIAPHVFDIKPLDRVTKRKNVITIDVRPDVAAIRDPRLNRRDPRKEKRKPRDAERKREDKKPEPEKDKKPENCLENYIDKFQLPDPVKINKLPPIPKINRDEGPKDTPVPVKKRKEMREKKKKREERDADKEDEKESDKDSSNSSPEKRSKSKETSKRLKEKRPEPEPEKPKEPEPVAFKELKNYHKDRYMRRNKEKSESPEKLPELKKPPSPVKESSSKTTFYVKRALG